MNTSAVTLVPISRVRGPFCRCIKGITASLTVLIGSAAMADTYYVDVDWTGASHGTAEYPFKTLEAAAAVFAEGDRNVVKVAGGVYKSEAVGGSEDFGGEGYNLNGKNGRWIGGYVGWKGEDVFDWRDKTRTLPDAEDMDEEKMTIVDLSKANSRAFRLNAYNVDTDFDGFLFRNAKIAKENYPGGALVLRGGMGASEVFNCVFLNNETTGEGGGLYHSGRGGTSKNCTFIGNRGSNGGGASMHPGNSEQGIVNFTFINNRATGNGGGLYVPTQTVNVYDSLMRNNEAENLGGGISTGGAIKLYKCEITGNKAANGAGFGFSGHSGANVLMQNCLVADNQGTNEDAIAILLAANRGGSLALRHVTVAGNKTPGGAVKTSGTRVEVRNTILAGQGGGIGIESDDGDAVIEYNNIAGFVRPVRGGVSASRTLIYDPPRFVDPESGKYRITVASPSSNAGTDIGVETDINGNPRPYSDKDPGVDMGCYEDPRAPRDTILFIK